jgi:hypothetical protein
MTQNIQGVNANYQLLNGYKNIPVRYGCDSLSVIEENWLETWAWKTAGCTDLLSALADPVFSEYCGDGPARSRKKRSSDWRFPCWNDLPE